MVVVVGGSGVGVGGSEEVEGGSEEVEGGSEEVERGSEETVVEVELIIELEPVTDLELVCELKLDPVSEVAEEELALAVPDEGSGDPVGSGPSSPNAQGKPGLMVPTLQAELLVVDELSALVDDVSVVVVVVDVSVVSVVSVAVSGSSVAVGESSPPPPPVGGIVGGGTVMPGTGLAIIQPLPPGKMMNGTTMPSLVVDVVIVLDSVS